MCSSGSLRCTKPKFCWFRYWVGVWGSSTGRGVRVRREAVGGVRQGGQIQFDFSNVPSFIKVPRNSQLTATNTVSVMPPYDIEIWVVPLLPSVVTSPFAPTELPTVAIVSLNTAVNGADQTAKLVISALEPSENVAVADN